MKEDFAAIPVFVAVIEYGFFSFLWITRHDLLCYRPNWLNFNSDNYSARGGSPDYIKQHGKPNVPDGLRKHLPEKVKVFIDFMKQKLVLKSGYWDAE